LTPIDAVIVITNKATLSISDYIVYKLQISVTSQWWWYSWQCNVLCGFWWCD